MHTDWDELTEMAERTTASYLDDVLQRWHRWCQADTNGTGYPAESSMFRYRKPSRTWDDRNGAMDAIAENSQCEAVDAIIDGMSRVHRAALSMQARNLATGLSVWGSPLLPTDQTERAHVVAQAREALADRMRAAKLWWA